MIFFIYKFPKEITDWVQLYILYFFRNQVTVTLQNEKLICEPQESDTDSLGEGNEQTQEDNERFVLFNLFTYSVYLLILKIPLTFVNALLNISQ